MKRMLVAETDAVKRGEQTSASLMTSFASALDTSVADLNGLKKPADLSAGGTLGNMLFISFAGHDTTANLLAFAVHLLAMEPDVRDWIAEVKKVAIHGTNW